MFTGRAYPSRLTAVFIDSKLGGAYGVFRAGRCLAPIVNFCSAPAAGPLDVAVACFCSRSVRPADLRSVLARQAVGVPKRTQLGALWQAFHSHHMQAAASGYTSVADRAKQRRDSRNKAQPAPGATLSTSPVRLAKKAAGRKTAPQEEASPLAAGPPSLEASHGQKRASKAQAIALLSQCLPELAAATADLKGADAASALEFLDSAQLTAALSRLEGTDKQSSSNPTADSLAPNNPSDPSPAGITASAPDIVGDPHSTAQALLAQLRRSQDPESSLAPDMAPSNPPKARGRPPAKGSAASKRRAKTAASGLSDAAAAELAEQLAQADPALLDRMIDAASQATAQPTADPAAGLEAFAGNGSANLEAPSQNPTTHPDRANSTLASNDAVLIAGGALSDQQEGGVQKESNVAAAGGSAGAAAGAASPPSAVSSGLDAPSPKRRATGSKRSRIRYRTGASAAEMALAQEAARGLEAAAELAAAPAGSLDGKDKVPALKRKGPASKKAAAATSEGALTAMPASQHAFLSMHVCALCSYRTIVRPVVLAGQSAESADKSICASSAFPRYYSSMMGRPHLLTLLCLYVLCLEVSMDPNDSSNACLSSYGRLPVRVLLTCTQLVRVSCCQVSSDTCSYKDGEASMPVIAMPAFQQSDLHAAGSL